jgi:hypothetical protein
MRRKKPNNVQLHSAFITKISTEPVQSQHTDFPDQNIIVKIPTSPIISPSSSELNRSVEHQLEFTSSYFEKLQQQHPELSRSGGGGVQNKEYRENKTTNQSLPPAIISDVSFLVDSTIQQLNWHNQPKSQKPPNYYQLLGGDRQPPEE